MKGNYSKKKDKYVPRDNGKSKDNRYNKENNQVKQLSINTNVFIHVSHPDNRKNIYLCQGRIIRQPRRRDNPLYKVLVTAVSPLHNQDFFAHKILGMKVLRTISAIKTETPSFFVNKETVWESYSEKEILDLVRISVKRIRREPLIQARNNPIKKLF